MNLFPPCVRCRRPRTSKNEPPFPGSVQHGSGDLCDSCHRQGIRGTNPIGRLFESPEWMEDGLCAQADPDAWFPEPGGNPEGAKSICRTCPVARECLEYALRNKEHGVWGATTEHERAAILRARKRGRAVA